MPFRGKPSKACGRCRERRLKCDLSPYSCGQCSRARQKCPGYRYTSQLRVRNESEDVRMKVLSKRSPLSNPSLPIVTIRNQAWETFFAHYVIGPSKTWDFLLPYYDPATRPVHLNLAIEAVSLAHFSHHSYSTSGLENARQIYTSALHMTKKAIQIQDIALKDTTLLTTLLLDLYEKITSIESHHVKSWMSHVSGALALVRLRGLDHFQEPEMIKVLIRLSTNALISCVASDSPVPQDLIDIREYVGSLIEVKDPKWQLSDLMVEYAGLRSNIRGRYITLEESIQMSRKLDDKLRALALNMPRSWHYHKIHCEETSISPIRQYNVYPDRHVTQTWNVLRLVRILLNEYILKHDSVVSKLSTISSSETTIYTLQSEISASLPQYLDCLDTSTCPDKGNHHSNTKGVHSPSQKQDCYSLIFPLYVAARSDFASASLKAWAIDKLRCIGSHFDIRNATIVAGILENVFHGDDNPWSVYAILGGYAFAA